jgi:hypothetical protein
MEFCKEQESMLWLHTVGGPTLKEPDCFSMLLQETILSHLPMKRDDTWPLV